MPPTPRPTKKPVVFMKPKCKFAPRPKVQITRAYKAALAQAVGRVDYKAKRAASSSSGANQAAAEFEVDHFWNEVQEDEDFEAAETTATTSEEPADTATWFGAVTRWVQNAGITVGEALASIGIGSHLSEFTHEGEGDDDL